MIHFHPLLHRMWPEPPVFRAVRTLIRDEAGEDGSHHGGVKHALATIYQQGCQQEVMNEEDDQIDGKEFPYHQYLWPIKGKKAIVYRTDIHA